MLKAVAGFGIVMGPTAALAFVAGTNWVDQDTARKLTVAGVIWFVVSLVVLGLIWWRDRRKSPTRAVEPIDDSGGSGNVTVPGDQNIIINIQNFYYASETLRRSGPREIDIESSHVVASVTKDAIRIVDRATAVVTRASANAGGLVVVEPPSQTELASAVVTALAGAATGQGTAHDATVTHEALIKTGDRLHMDIAGLRKRGPGGLLETGDDSQLQGSNWDLDDSVPDNVEPPKDQTS